MNTACLLILYVVATLYFGAHVLRIIPTFLRLLVALRAGTVKWPGPRIHDSDRSASTVRANLGVGYENLFLTFARNSLVVSGALFYSVSGALAHTPVLSPFITIEQPVWEWVFLAVAFVGGGMAANRCGAV